MLSLGAWCRMPVIQMPQSIKILNRSKDYYYYFTIQL